MPPAQLPPPPTHVVLLGPDVVGFVQHDLEQLVPVEAVRERRRKQITVAIARLAAEGLSNREIGQRLYLSPRTIGSCLYRIFPKLGIRSRSELATLLAGS